MRKIYISNIDIDKIENVIIDRKIEDEKTTDIIVKLVNNCVNNYVNKLYISIYN